MKKMISMVMVLAAVCAAFGETYEKGKVYGPIVELGDEARTIDGNGAIIDGGGTARCATLGPNVTLKNFTFRNGKAAFGGGVWGGRIENCAIRDCIATESGAAVANCKARATTISGCRRPLNGSVKAATHGGIAADSTLDGVTITGCRVELGPSVPGFGGIAANSALDDCAVTDNTLVIAGDHYGLLFYGGSLRKSTIQGNSVDSSLANVAAYMKVTPDGCALDGDKPLPPPGTHTLTVNPNSPDCGTVSGSGNYAAGKKVTLKAKPKDGYVFAGWFTDKKCTKQLDPEGYDNRKPAVKYVMPAKKTTVYAKFITKDEDKKALKFSKSTAKLAKTPKSFVAGEAMSLKLGFASSSLPTVTAKDLPAGMAIDKATGEITGTPTKPGAYVAKVAVKSAAGNKITQDVKINVTAPSWAYGTFYGYGAVIVKGKAVPVSAKFTSTEVGKVSGKVTYKGKAAAFTASYASATAKESRFTVKFSIGGTVYKSAMSITKENDGFNYARAHALDEDAFELEMQKPVALVRKGKTLAAMVGKKYTFTKDSKNAGLTKKGDKLVVKFADKDVVKVAGIVGGKKFTGYSAPVMAHGKSAKGGKTAYVMDVPVVEATTKYYRLLTFKVTIDSKKKVTKVSKAFTKIE